MPKPVARETSSVKPVYSSVLTINGGSSSIRFAVYEQGEPLRRRHPTLSQVACFDTAFHHTMPRAATLLPIPRRYEAAGVRRYGFHGLSYEFLMEELARLGDPADTKGRAHVTERSA